MREDLPVYRMGHVALNVTDLARSEKFYVELLGMRPVWRSEGEIVFLECGNDDLALIQLPKARGEAYSQHQPFQFLNHIGFRVRTKEAVDQAAEAIRSKGIVIQDGPRDHRDGSRSFYFEDPDGNSIQILWDPRRESP
ncbi:MAG: VOC family protein [candidate division NC10 bacterium]|nr:VOC family protein [candidate division NC10 bacterium]